MSEVQDRINEKLLELEQYLEELESITPENFEEYSSSSMIKAACERYFEKIMEAIVSISFLFIREKNLKSPESEEHAFIILSNNRIISEELSERLRKAKDMRNRVIHNYGEVDDKIVFHAIGEELRRDAEEFVDCVIKKCNKLAR